MARFDPREKEIDRRQGWRDGNWVEFILTNEQMVWKISVLVNGDLYATFDEDTDCGDIVQMICAEQRFIGTFDTLLDRFLHKEAA